MRRKGFIVVWWIEGLNSRSGHDQWELASDDIFKTRKQAEFYRSEEEYDSVEKGKVIWRIVPVTLPAEPRIR